ncbi:hypothetical protein KEM60_00091 [Austwickia sp. TVS 96-490-7B]|uniref:hypothetical protein n=1 Tax=Austwickia sp. TVS 96-490-7B TaxID=2830843 RepID=UPI001C59E1BE|nr:hypothetical protein [Austwickia sp. TVS 96-490-7B]MBW3083909.1 hypothetical protein [Austwickia sp. TVS 96-490-7B]
MSKKSRQPEAAAQGGKGGKKGRRGKKGQAEEGTRAQLVVETAPEGVPFAVVVLLAMVMCLPSLSTYQAGGLAFDALMMRVFAALAVAWLLSHLVYAVVEAVRPPKVEAVVEIPPEQAFHAMARQDALSGRIVSDPHDESGHPIPGDPFAVEPVEPAAIPAVSQAGVQPVVGEVRADQSAA